MSPHFLGVPCFEQQFHCCELFNASVGRPSVSSNWLSAARPDSLCLVTTEGVLTRAIDVQDLVFSRILGRLMSQCAVSKQDPHPGHNPQSANAGPRARLLPSHMPTIHFRLKRSQRPLDGAKCLGAVLAKQHHESRRGPSCDHISREICIQPWAKFASGPSAHPFKHSSRARPLFGVHACHTQWADLSLVPHTWWLPGCLHDLDHI